MHENLEDLTLKVLNDSKNVEVCHWIKTQGSKKVIIKFLRRKDANKVQTEKKKLKGKNLTSLGINKPVYKMIVSVHTIRNSGLSVQNCVII